MIAGLFGGLGLFGLLPWQGGELYEDPQGRFTVRVDPTWEQVETDGPYTQFKVADPPMDMYFLVLDAKPIDDAFAQAVEILGFDPDSLAGGAVAGVGDWQAFTNEDSAGLAYGFAGQIVGENDYILAVKIYKPGVGVDNATVMGVMTSLKITGKDEIVIESYADLEAFVRNQVDSLAGSISIAVLYQDKLMYYRQGAGFSAHPATSYISWKCI